MTSCRVEDKPSVPESSRRMPQLDGLRGLAMVSVVTYHYYNVRLLWGGVDMFFILSGFLITSILLRRNEETLGRYLGEFYRKRARRVLPPYLLLLVVTTFVSGTPWLQHWYMYVGAMNLFYPLQIPIPGQIMLLWSLAVEEQFYLLWPLAVYFVSRRILFWLTLVIIASAPVLRYVCTPLFGRHWAIYMLLPFRMDDLAVGALVAQLWPTCKRFLERNTSIRCILYIFCAILIVMSFALLFAFARQGMTTNANTRWGNTLLYETILVLMLSTFVAALAGFGGKVLGWSVFVWLGTISYSAYLIHDTMLILLPGHAKVPAIFATLAYAALSWYAIERPLTRAKERAPENLAVLEATS